MAITIEPKEKHTYEGGASYIRITGQLREDIRLIAAWSGRKQQDVGEDLLKQAVKEVLPQIPKNQTYMERNSPRGQVRNRRR
jgi:hypothetical protein